MYYWLYRKNGGEVLAQSVTEGAFVEDNFLGVHESESLPNIDMDKPKVFANGEIHLATAAEIEMFPDLAAEDDKLKKISYLKSLLDTSNEDGKLLRAIIKQMMMDMNVQVTYEDYAESIKNLVDLE